MYNTIKGYHFEDSIIIGVSIFITSCALIAVHDLADVYKRIRNSFTLNGGDFYNVCVILFLSYIFVAYNFIHMLPGGFLDNGINVYGHLIGFWVGLLSPLLLRHKLNF